MVRHACMFALIAGLLLAPLPARAEDAEPPVDCANAMSTHEMNFCADAAFQAADAKLNDIYQRSLKRVEGMGSEKPYDAQSFVEALRKSQRAWVAFRDADCKDLVPMIWAGGTATTAEVLGCLTSKTTARSEELRERYLLE